jgi:uncharacterized protein Yka (UPF0111/DUF47 family)
MSDDLVNQLWESDEASALTNRAARRIEELEAREEAIARAALERAYHLYDDEGPDAYISVLKIKHDLTALADIAPKLAAILKNAAGEDWG